eukprot:1139496-Pelagomonas_calceolata.AAC.6
MEFQGKSSLSHDIGMLACPLKQDCLNAGYIYFIAALIIGTRVRQGSEKGMPIGSKREPRNLSATGSKS